MAGKLARIISDMRREIPALIALALLFATGAAPRDDFGSAEWKDEIARGYLPYRKLTYDDFPIADGVPIPHWMHTEGFVHYGFKASWSSDGGRFRASVTEFSVRSGFDQNKSWRRSTITATKALLEHEQGHLDLIELHAADFRKATLPSGAGVSGPAALEDLRQKLEALADRYSAEGRTEQDLYDVQTGHGAKPDAQALWTAQIRKRLRERGITPWDQRAS